MVSRKVSDTCKVVVARNSGFVVQVNLIFRVFGGVAAHDNCVKIRRGRSSVNFNFVTVNCR